MNWLILVKVVVIYILILVVMKFMGKREIGQLSLFDFVVILIIADFAVVGTENAEVPFYIYLIGIVLIGVIQKILAFILLRFSKLRTILDGKQSIIMIDGKLNIKEMKKQSYNMDDLVMQTRLKNIRSLSEIKYLVLEANGEISVFKFSDFSSQNSNSSSNANSNAKANTSDPKQISKGSERKDNNSQQNQSSKQDQKSQQSQNSQQSQGQEIYPFPLIVSGQVSKENLKVMNFTEDWLLKEIKKHGYQDYKNIYYANWENGKLFIVQTCDF